MAEVFDLSKKICGTCNFWAGLREFDHPNQKVIIEALATKGLCMGPASCGWNGLPKQANGSCNGYLIWEPEEK